MTTIAVTGATGFVGRAVVRRLLRTRSPNRLRLLVRNPTRRAMLETFASTQLIDGDLHTEAALNELVDKADTVIHIAAVTAGNSAQDFDHNNRVGTQNLLQACKKHAAHCHVIHLSSLAAREPELSWYASSKHAAEQAVAASQLNYSILRPPAVYGPDDPALADFWRWLARGWLIRLGPADSRFSLLHVDDLAEAIARLATHGTSRQIMSLHDGHTSDRADSGRQAGWSWSALAELAAAIRGASIQTVAIPSAVLGAAARINLKFAQIRGRSAMLSPGKKAELMHPDWVCDNSAIQSVLNWQPTTSLAQSLATLPGWNHP